MLRDDPRVKMRSWPVRELIQILPVILLFLGGEIYCSGALERVAVFQMHPLRMLLSRNRLPLFGGHVLAGEAVPKGHAGSGGRGAGECGASDIMLRRCVAVVDQN